MSTEEIDDYLDSLDEPKKSTLAQMRSAILSVIPGADQGMAYGVPAFRLDGKPVAGFAAFKNHLSYLPHSGNILSELAADVAGYETSKGVLRFAIDTPLPVELIEKLIAARRDELRSD